MTVWCLQWSLSATVWGICAVVFSSHATFCFNSTKTFFLKKLNTLLSIVSLSLPWSRRATPSTDCGILWADMLGKSEITWSYFTNYVFKLKHIALVIQSWMFKLCYEHKNLRNTTHPFTIKIKCSFSVTFAFFQQRQTWSVSVQCTSVPLIV